MIQPLKSCEGRMRSVAWTGDGLISYLEVAIFPSNTYVGRSRVFGTLYRTYTLQPGDMILDQPGGVSVYVAVEKATYRARFSPQDRHIFERGGPTGEGVPAAAVPVEFTTYPSRSKPVALGAYPHLAGYPGAFPFGAMDYLTFRCGGA